MKFFIHIGYPKTASTYLQKNIFPNIEDASYIGKPFSVSFTEIINNISQLADSEFELKKNDLIKSLEKDIKNYNCNKIIISQEGFLYSLAYHTKEKPKGHDIYVTIKRLHHLLSIFGEVKFLFIIRKHTDLLESLFFEASDRFRFDYNENDLICNLKNNSKKNIFLLENLFFGKVYNFLKQLSNENKVMLFEDLEKNKAKFFSELSNFLELKKNPNYSKFNQTRLNSRLEKKKVSYLLTTLRPLLPSLKSLWYHKFNLRKYNEKLSLVKMKLFQAPKMRNIQMKKYEKLVYEFYKSDLNNFPMEIKKQLYEYKYL